MPGLSLGLCRRSDPRRAEGMESGPGNSISEASEEREPRRKCRKEGKCREGKLLR